jgi:myo-inositol 2-dehydrogenase/D-chiro-inositol 1-dehydrogenase
MADVALGVIGCGGMARAHMRNAVRVPGLRLRGYADAVPAAAERFRHEFGGDYATADPERVLRDPAVDAVLIATHHDSHPGLAVRAARAGKHVLIEKPLALTVDECLRVEEAVAHAGVVLMVGFQRRFAPLVLLARRLVPRPFLSLGQMMDNRWGDTIWTQDPIRGGGNVISQGCHTFDLLCYLHQDEPVAVYAAGGTFTHDPQATTVIDNVAATVRFAGGGAAAVVQGDGGLPEHVSKFFFEVFDGERAAQLYDRLHHMTVSGPGQLPTARYAAAAEAPGEDPEGLAQELAEFVRCAASGVASPIGATARDGTRATALALAIFESVRTGQPQPLSLPRS